MQLVLDHTIRHIFILGAGASVDYGLPTWRDLSLQIKERVAKENTYNFGSEILSWMEKVGENKIYKTLDECIVNEAISENHHMNGIHVEDEIFSVIRQIFIEKYHPNPNGWINKLNRKILNKKEMIDQLAFVDYNYDHVLEDNFLNYEYLPEKHRRLNFKNELNILSSSVIQVLCPHGTFTVPGIKHSSRIKKIFKTIKTDDGELLDVVSCYESNPHSITLNHQTNFPRNLYILGLGGGLEVNMRNMQFGFELTEIHVTMKDKKYLNDIVSFLAKKFKKAEEEIKVHDSCSDIIEKCF